MISEMSSEARWRLGLVWGVAAAYAVRPAVFGAAVQTEAAREGALRRAESSRPSLRVERGILRGTDRVLAC